MDLSVVPGGDLDRLMTVAGEQGRRLTGSSMESSAADNTQAANTTAGRRRRRLTMEMTAALVHRARRGASSAECDFTKANLLAFNDTAASAGTDFCSEKESELSAEERARAFLESGCGGLSLLDASRLLEQLRSPNTRRTRRGTRRTTGPLADTTLAKLGDDGVAALLHMVDEQLNSFSGSFSESEDEQPSADETVLEAERTLTSDSQQTSEEHTLEPGQDDENRRPVSEQRSLLDRPGKAPVLGSVRSQPQSETLVTLGSRAALTDMSNTPSSNQTSAVPNANRSIVAGSLEETLCWSGRDSMERTRLSGSPRASMRLSTAMPLLQSTPRVSKVGSEFSLRLEASSDVQEETAVSKCVTNVKSMSVRLEGDASSGAVRKTLRNRRKKGPSSKNSSGDMLGQANVTEKDDEMCSRLQSMTLSNSVMAQMAEPCVLSELEPSTTTCEFSEFLTPANREGLESRLSELSSEQSEQERPPSRAAGRRKDRKRGPKPKGQATRSRNATQMEAEAEQSQLQRSTVMDDSDASARLSKVRRRTIEMTAALIQKATSGTSTSAHPLEARLPTFEGSMGSAAGDQETCAEERARAFLESGCGGLSLLDASRLLEQLRSPNTRRTRRGTRRTTGPLADTTLAKLGDDGVAALLLMVDEQLNSFRGSFSESEDDQPSADETVLEAERTLVQNQSQDHVKQAEETLTVPETTEKHSTCADEHQVSDNSSQFHSAVDEGPDGQTSYESIGAWLDKSHVTRAGGLDQTSLRLSTAVPLLQSTPRCSAIGSSQMSLRLEASSALTEASNFSRATRASTASRVSTSRVSRTSTASRASEALGPITDACDVPNSCNNELSPVFEAVDNELSPVSEAVAGTERSSVTEDAVIASSLLTKDDERECRKSNAPQEETVVTLDEDMELTLQENVIEDSSRAMPSSEEEGCVRVVNPKWERSLRDAQELTSSSFQNNAKPCASLGNDSPASTEPRILACASMISEPTETVTAPISAALARSSDNPGILSATMSSFRAPKLRSPGTANSSLTGMSEISIRRPVTRDSLLAPTLAAAACELSLVAGPDASGRRGRANRSRVAPAATSFVDDTLHEEGEDDEWEDAEAPQDGEEVESADGEKKTEVEDVQDRTMVGEPVDEAKSMEVREIDNIDEPEDVNVPVVEEPEPELAEERMDTEVNVSVASDIRNWTAPPRKSQTMDRTRALDVSVSSPAQHGSATRRKRSSRPRANRSGIVDASRLDVSDLTCNIKALVESSAEPLFSSTMREDSAKTSRGSANSLSTSFGGSGQRLALFDSPEVNSPGEVSALHRSSSSKMSRSRLGSSARHGVVTTKATSRSSRSRMGVSGSDRQNKSRSGMSVRLDDTMDRNTPVPAPALTRLPAVGGSPSPVGGGGDTSEVAVANVSRSSRCSKADTSRSRHANSSRGSQASRSQVGRADTSAAGDGGSPCADEPEDLESTLVGDGGAFSCTPAGPDGAGDRDSLLNESSINSPGLSFFTRPSGAGDPTRLSVAPGDALASSALLGEFSGELDESDEESYYSEEEDFPAESGGLPRPPRTAAGRRPTRQERFAELFPDGAGKTTATEGAGKKRGARKKMMASPRSVGRSHVRLFAVSDAMHKKWLKANATGLRVTADAQREFVSALEQYEQLVLAQLTEVMDGRERVTTADVLELLRRSGVAPTPADVRRLVRTHLPMEVQLELLRVTEAGGGVYPAADPLGED